MTTPTKEINQYLTDIDSKYRQGNATEHSYRPALQTLFEAITTGLSITNEPSRIECGAPDYIITRDGVPVGYIEAKDIPVGIHDKTNKAQFDRYKQSLNNLIITDYINFELFIDGDLRLSATIGTASEKGIVANKEKFAEFAALVDCFIAYEGKTITNSAQLANMMAKKARLLSETIKDALNSLNTEEDSLGVQLKGFQKILIHDLSNETFADMYAQTLSYGMFAARLNDKANAKFSRKSAADLIPRSNPFLRKFFQYIAGYDLDDRICWIVDALADIFNCVAIDELLKEFDKQHQDPFVHFYETFLCEYDMKLRESRGVYYTPFPAVQFIVQAIDDILVKDFSLPQGLADTKVHILEPALGTGTFLSAVIDKIYERFVNQKGLWQSYCTEHLLPRLNGFEILMAPYTMAHFKLDMKLKETGYESKERLRVFLTNSLEQSETVIQDLPFASWLSDEAIEASKVKRDAPVMVVMGNPPYSVSTQNKGEWIQNLIADYKTGLHEKKLNLDDDYIKFIRYGQYFVDKHGSGILAYVSNNSFIDGITHRQMRKQLLKSFDTIYILNLHGNARKKEVVQDGITADENIFNIMQGVSINIFVKTEKNIQGQIAQVFYSELFGKRETKMEFLLQYIIGSVHWKKLYPKEPYYFFAPKDFSNKAEYDKGFSVTDLFLVYNSGIKTDRDTLFIDMDKKTLDERMKKLFSGDSDENFRTKYNVSDSGSYKLTKAIASTQFSGENIHPVLYRPFDKQYIYYQQGFTSRPAFNVMRHFLDNIHNIGLTTSRSIPPNQNFDRVFVTNSLADIHSASDQTYIFPLYLYSETGELDTAEKRRPNLNMHIVDEIAAKIGLRFTPEKVTPVERLLNAPNIALDGVNKIEKGSLIERIRGTNPGPQSTSSIINDTKLLGILQGFFVKNQQKNDEFPKTFAPIDILDYIYAVLHSPTYREKYREFLKINFPRVPYPENAGQFFKLAAFGETLRKIHLLEGVEPSQEMGLFPVEGSRIVEKTEYKNGQIWINKTQYFNAVPPEVWDFYIGGYQSAQKWLKDRKGRVLDFDQIQHYQRILAALRLTGELMAQVDEVAAE
jgi:predicted helicase